MAPAQSGQQAHSAVPFDVLWQHITTLDLVEALTFIAFGTVWLFYGWRIFKVLVTISFALLGMTLGIWANQELIAGNSFWLGLICAVFFGVLSIPFMHWGVSILGAISGAALTAGAVLALGLHDQKLLLAGAIIGLVAGGMISFIIFKIAVVLFTSLGGSILLAVGALAIMCHHMMSQEQFKTFLLQNTWFMPATVLVPMAIGIFLQNKFIKAAPDWNA
jgi:hypothetical protein